MKNCMFVLFALALALSLCACGEEQGHTPTEENVPPPTVQIGNPIQELSSAEELRQCLRFRLDAPAGAEDCRYSVIGGRLGQVLFVSDGTEYCLRGFSFNPITAKEDISGVYGPFEETEESLLIDHSIESCEIQIRYTTEGGAVANWYLNLNYMQYSMSAAQVPDKETFCDFVSKVVSEQLDRLQEEERERALNDAIEGHAKILSGGQTYQPYITVAYGASRDEKGMISFDCPPAEPRKLKSTGALPCVIFGDNFEVAFTDGGKLDNVILYNGEYNRLEDRWNLDFFADLESGTYFVNIIMHEDRSGGEYTGYQCVFELVVP